MGGSRLRLLQFEKRREHHCQESYGFHHEKGKFENFEDSCKLLNPQDPMDKFLSAPITNLFEKLVPKFNTNDFCRCVPFITPGDILFPQR